VRTGKELHRFSPHGGEALALAYSPDGKTLATAGKDRLIHLWDAGTFSLRQTCRGHAGAVNALAFAPDGRLVSGGKDTTVRVWSPDTGEELFVRRGHQSQVCGVAVDPATKRIVSAGEDTLIKAWRADQPQEAETLALHQGAATALAFSPDGGVLVSVGLDGAVWRIDPEGKERPRKLRQEDRPLRQVRFLPRSRTLLLTGGGPGRGDGAIRLLDADDGAVRGELATGLAACSWLNVSRDGKWLVVVGRDQGEKASVQVWSLPERRRLHEISAPDAAVALLWSGSAKLYVLNNRGDSRSPDLVGYDLTGGARRFTSSSHSFDRGYRFAIWNGDESLMIVGGAHQNLSIRQTSPTGVIDHHSVLYGHAALVLSAAMSPDDKLLATASEDETVRLWDFANRMELLVLRGDPGAMTDVAFSPDGQLLAAAQASGAVRLWSAGPAQAGRLHPDGDR
jgi:WD40 repeat protein